MKPEQFAVLMQKELDANKLKGKWDKWKPTRKQAIKELKHHVEKLESIVQPDGITEFFDYNKAIEYAADVANICMKIASMAKTGGRF